VVVIKASPDDHKQTMHARMLENTEMPLALPEQRATAMQERKKYAARSEASQRAVPCCESYVTTGRKPASLSLLIWIDRRSASSCWGDKALTLMRYPVIVPLS
jgi:hypothetical protein